MTVWYKYWLKDRTNSKSRLQLDTVKYNVTDMLETALSIMIQKSDIDYECYRVDLLEISDFT